MPPSQEIQKRINALLELLNKEITGHWNKGIRNHRVNLILMIITLIASVVAGVGGLLNKLDSQTIGAIALLPGATSLIAVTMKIQGKASWHYRKRDALESLKSRLRFELPESPTADHVAAIAKARRELIKAMQEEWDRDLTLNWTGFQQSNNKRQGL